MPQTPLSRYTEAQQRFITTQVRRLLAMGYVTPGEIHRAMLKRFGIEMQWATAQCYIKRAQKELATTIPDSLAARNMEVEVLLETRRQAYEALERSKKDFESRLKETTTETVGEYQKDRVKESLRTEARNADAKYMAIILDTSAQLRQLLGLDAAQKLDLSVSGATPERKEQPINFDQLYERVPIVDPAAERIKQLEAGPQLITEDPNGVLRPQG